MTMQCERETAACGGAGRRAPHRMAGHAALHRVLLLAALLFVVAPRDARACDTLLVSGFDDVLRQADNTGLLRAGRRLLQPDATYAGMPELYRAIACAQSDPAFVVVSAISRVFTGRAERLLVRSGYPPAELQFRRWLLDWSPRRFKRERIAALLAQHPSRRVVFVFDNSDTSIALGRDLLADHGARVAAIYLRETVAREHPPGVTPFLTAFDIAAHEFAAGRLSADDAVRVAAALLAASDPRHVVPNYAHCPTSLPRCDERDRTLQQQCARVRERVLTICASRQAGTERAEREVRP
jgi:hypothetical protein